MRGDELGRAVMTASLVRDLMQIGLLQHRRYPPYAKWLGSAYAELARPETAALGAALRATDWRAAERALTRAYRVVARAHNALDVTAPVDPEPRSFHDRPIRVLDADRLVDALRAAISDPAVLAVDHLAGAVDAVSDNTDVVTRRRLWRQLVGLYDRAANDVGERETDGM